MNRPAITAVIAVMIALIGAMGLWNTHQVKDTMCAQLETAKQAALSGDASQAEKTAQQIQAFWEKQESKLFLYIRHNELDEIEKNIAELKYLAELGDTAEFCSKASQAKALVEHIWECELPLIKNIL